LSVIKGILLKPLPYPRPGELVAVDHAAPGVNLPKAGAAPFLYFTYREDSRMFQDIALWRSGTVSVTGLAEPEDVRSLDVTQGLLPLLAVQPALGRWFSQGDDAPGSPETVILTAGYWRSKFGATRRSSGDVFSSTAGPGKSSACCPIRFDFSIENPRSSSPCDSIARRRFWEISATNALARLKPGVTIQQANADVARLIPLAIQRFPPYPGYSAKMFQEARLAPALRSLKQDLTGDVSTVLWVLMGTIGL
jgi:hypothetical protein